MARIRSIKPDFFTSETVARLDMIDRLLFVGIWTHVDDNGVCIDNPALVRAAVFPLDECVDLRRIAGGLRRLAEEGLIARYTIDGKRFLHVVAWDEHQKISHPSKARYPASDQAQETYLSPPESVVSPPDILRPDQGAGNGAGSREQGVHVDPLPPEPTTTLVVAVAPTRRRDLPFEALCSVTGSDYSQLTTSARGQYGKALSEIRAVSRDLSDEELAQEIGVRATRYISQMGDARITASALAKHWGSLTQASEIVQSPNARRSFVTPDRAAARMERFRGQS